VQNNGVINVGTVGLSNSPGVGTKSMGRIGPKHTFPERVSTTCSRSDSLGEQQADFQSSPAQGAASELHQCSHSRLGKVAGLFSSLDPQQFQGRKIEENAHYWILPTQWYWEESERQNLVMK